MKSEVGEEREAFVHECNLKAVLAHDIKRNDTIRRSL